LKVAAVVRPALGDGLDVIKLSVANTKHRPAVCATTLLLAVNPDQIGKRE